MLAAGKTPGIIGITPNTKASRENEVPPFSPVPFSESDSIWDRFVKVLSNVPVVSPHGIDGRLFADKDFKTGYFATHTVAAASLSCIPSPKTCGIVVGAALAACTPMTTPDGQKPSDAGMMDGGMSTPDAAQCSPEKTVKLEPVGMPRVLANGNPLPVRELPVDPNSAYSNVCPQSIQQVSFLISDGFFGLSIETGATVIGMTTTQWPLVECREREFSLLDPTPSSWQTWNYNAALVESLFPDATLFHRTPIQPKEEPRVLIPYLQGQRVGLVSVDLVSFALLPTWHQDLSSSFSLNHLHPLMKEDSLLLLASTAQQEEKREEEIIDTTKFVAVLDLQTEQQRSLIQLSEDPVLYQETTIEGSSFDDSTLDSSRRLHRGAVLIHGTELWLVEQAILQGREGSPFVDQSGSTTLTQYDLATGQIIRQRRLPLHLAFQMSTTSDGKIMIVGITDQTADNGKTLAKPKVLLLDPQDGHVLAQQTIEHTFTPFSQLKHLRDIVSLDLHAEVLLFKDMQGITHEYHYKNSVYEKTLNTLAFEALQYTADWDPLCIFSDEENTPTRLQQSFSIQSRRGLNRERVFADRRSDIMQWSAYSLRFRNDKACYAVPQSGKAPWKSCKDEIGPFAIFGTEGYFAVGDEIDVVSLPIPPVQ